MRLVLSSFLQLLALSAQLVGAAKPKSCTTSFGKKSLSTVPTTTTTVKSTVYSSITITKYHTSTVTPKPTSTTSTSTTTFTTGTIVKATTTITNYEFTFITKTQTKRVPPLSTVTIISTTSSTYTDPAATTTIPAPAGFTPVLRTLSGSKQRRGLEKKPKLLLAKRKPTQYPVAVTCTVVKTTTTVLSTTVTDRKTTVTTTAAPSTVTKSKIKTETETLTFVEPPDSTFVTSTITTTETTTVTAKPKTTTTTSTSTISVPANTAYAACAPDSSNYAGAVNYFGSPSGIDDLVVPSSVNNFPIQMSHASDCCTYCATYSDSSNNQCLAAGFDSMYNYCHLLLAQTTNRTSLGAGTHNVYEADKGYIISNGQYGIFDHTVYE